MSLRFASGLGLGMLVVTLGACAAPGAPDSPDSAEPAGGADEALVGGRAARSDELPSTVRFEIGCTGVKVGARQFLLAAHCVQDDTTNTRIPELAPGARVQLTNAKVDDGRAVRALTIASTQVAPAWVADCTAPCTTNVLGPSHPPDLAVIVVAEDTPDIPQARVDARPVAPGDRLITTGYGCEEGLSGSAGGVPRLKVDATTALAPSALLHAGSWITTDAEAASVAAAYVITPGHDADGAASSLCFGDSGGPLYRDGAGEPLVVGVNAYYTFRPPYDGVSQTNWHTRVDAQARGGVLDWLVATGVSVRRDDAPSSGPGSAAGPCAGLCASPVSFSDASHATGSLGAGAVCLQTTAKLSGLACGNFGAKRPLRVDGVTLACDGGHVPLPPPRNGGYCFQVDAGDPPWAWFSTW